MTDPHAPALAAMTLAQEASLRARRANQEGWGVWQCDRTALGALLDAYDARGRTIDAQAARLAAVERAARAVVQVESGSTWAAITDLAVALDGGAAGEGRDG